MLLLIYTFNYNIKMPEEEKKGKLNLSKIQTIL